MVANDLIKFSRVAEVSQQTGHFASSDNGIGNEEGRSEELLPG
jgi:hypothetical protein